MNNSLQAVLDRQQTKAPTRPSRKRQRSDVPPDAHSSRQGTRLIGGHFSPEVAKAIRILAAEEDVTVQSLLEEALSDLLVKKGKKAIV